MAILSFSDFKLLLEAEGDPIPPPADPAAEPTPPPADTSTAPPPPPPPSGPAPDFSMPGTELPPDPNAQPAQAAPRNDKIVFSDESHPWHLEYTDGGGVKRYNEYEFLPGEIDKWITDSGLDASRQEITNSIKTGEPLKKDVFDRLVSDVKAKKLGIDRGFSDIEYDPTGKTSTTDLELILLKSK